MSERTTPHNLEAERAVLGAVIVNKAAWSVAASTISGGDFFRDAHRRIFDACGALSEASVTIDLITLKDELTKRGELDEVGGPSYMSALTDGIPISANIEHYAEIVKEKARMRRIISAANDVLVDGYDAARPSRDVVEDGLRSLSAAIGHDPKASLVRADIAVHDFASSLVSGSLPPMLPTGYADIDALIGGFRKQDLIIVAGRPGTGKTSFCLQSAVSMARSGNPVVFFSLEMGVNRLAARMLAWRSRVEIGRAERRIASDSEYERIGAALGEEAEYPLYLQASARSVSEMWNWCRRVKNEYGGGLACAMVDYLQLLKGSSARSAESRQREVAEISRDLKAMAKDVDVTVVAMSQLSRASETRKDKRPQLSELRESGALEQDADLVLLLYRAEMHEGEDPNPNSEGICEAIIAKHRDGPVGVQKLAFLQQLAKFEDLARGF